MIKLKWMKHKDKQRQWHWNILEKIKKMKARTRENFYNLHTALTFCSSTSWFVKKRKKEFVTGQTYTLLNPRLNYRLYSCWIIISCFTHSLYISFNSMSTLHTMWNIRGLMAVVERWVKTVIWVWHTVLTCLEMLQLLESTLYLREINGW